MAARSWNLYLLCSDAKQDVHLRDALAQHLEGPALRGAVVYHDGRMPIGARREEWRVEADYRRMSKPMQTRELRWVCPTTDPPQVCEPEPRAPPSPPPSGPDGGI